MIVNGIYYNGQLIPEGYVDGKLLFDFEPPTLGLLSYDDLLNVNIVLNGSFVNSLADWNHTGGWAQSNGVAIYDGSYGQSRIHQAIEMENGSTYRIQLSVVSNSGTNGNRVRIGTFVLADEHMTARDYGATFEWTDPTALYDLEIYGADGEVFAIDDIILYKV